MLTHGGTINCHSFRQGGGVGRNSRSGAVCTVTDLLAGSGGRGRRERTRVDTTQAASPGWMRGYLRALGPGLVTGASDDDPSGIATYAQAGSSFGFGFLWTALLTFPLMAAVQEICDRTALATGKGLGELATERLGGKARGVVIGLVGLLIVANALNIAADLVAVGSGMHLLHAGPTAVWALVAGAAISALLVTGSFELVARVFKLLCVALLAYVAMLFVVKVNWGSVARGTFVPHLSLGSSYVALLVAILGTTISPYLFFWQSMHRLEEMRDEPEGGNKPEPLPEREDEAAEKKQRRSRFDVFSGMAFSNIVMFAIIVTTAATLGNHGKHNIQSAADAANALKPVAGRFASCPLRARLHRRGHARDPGPRRSRLRRNGRAARQSHRLLPLAPQGPDLLRPRPARHPRRRSAQPARHQPDPSPRVRRRPQRRRRSTVSRCSSC